MITKEKLEELYVHKGLSVNSTAQVLGCSPHKVIYWMNKYSVSRRSMSDALYKMHNPSGDPFKVKPVNSLEDAWLLGMGLGLYWGEGNKKNRWSLRLGNTDPELIKMFIRFLHELFGVDKSRLRFGLQIFSDIDPELALNYWVEALEVSPSQFGKVVVTLSGSLGTYRQKSQYGVLTVNFHNKKLRDIVVGMLPR